MKYVVTGGAGFIGCNIVRELVKRNEDVVVVDNFATGKKENLEDVKDKITLVEGSVEDLELLKKAFSGADFVLHLAAIPSVPRSVSDPLTSNNVNISGTLKVLLAARDCKVKKVVYSSSSAVYGETEKLPKDESINPDVISPYGLTKLAGEVYCKLFHDLYGLKYCALRYFNVFGPRQNPKSQYAAAIPIFINSILQDKQPPVFGDGTQTRDFTFVKNVVDANILAATSESIGIFNIACGGKISINSLISNINKVLGKNIKPDYLPERPGDIKHSMADITKAEKEMGFKPEVSLEEGLRKTIEWYR